MPRRRKTPRECEGESTQSSQESSSQQQGRGHPTQARPPAQATPRQVPTQAAQAQPLAQATGQAGKQQSRLETDQPQAAAPSASAVRHDIQPSEHTLQAGVGPSHGAMPYQLIKTSASTFQGASTSTCQVPMSSATGPPTDVTEQLQRIGIRFTLPEGTTTSQVHAPISSKKLQFPLRPGFGKAGMPCIVKANHFLAQLPDADLHQYDVSTVPEIKSRELRRAVMKQLVNIHRQSDLGQRLPVYDGKKSLYTAGSLPFKSKDFIIKHVDKDDESGPPRRNSQFRVTLKFAAKADLHHLSEFLSGRQLDAPQDALQVLDIVLRELPTQRFKPVGRSFYSPEKKHPLGGGLESWQGFYQSIRPIQMGLSLNIDMVSTAFIEPLPVLDFVTKLLGKNISRPLTDADWIKVKEALRGVKIEVTHRGKTRQKYRIATLTSRPTKDLSFVDDQGTTKFVVKYFKDDYKYEIKYTALPCLQAVNQKGPIYLPMEVCRIVDGQRYSECLNEKQISELLKATCQHPVERERSILKAVYDNNYANDEYAKEFGLSISQSLADVEARVLPAPQLKYHDGTGKMKDFQPKEGKWNMRDKKLVNGGQVTHWTCINFSQFVSENVAYNFCRELATMCRVSGMTFKLESAIDIQSAHPDEVESVLRWVSKEFSNIYPKEKLDLLLVILPDKNGALYGNLKRICETDLGLLSQCCLSKHVLKVRREQYLANVALKINVKIGGRNTVLADALYRRIPLVTDKPTIIFGADVTHPRPRDDTSPSIAAVVASQDWPEVTKYAGLVCAQAHRQEIIQDLFKSWEDPKVTQSGGMIRELMLSFYRNTRQKPDRIIFYRDGVSEGQFSQVLLYELDAIRKACASLEENYQPPVTFVVVQKRHHTRLFAHDHTNKSSVDESGNILPGTVVDRKICHPTQFDFYLCSHAGIQGTSRPAHYHVLWDENNFTADGLQMLTNNLCYTYARCTRSVSIVPPAYYAHLAAFRARFYMEPGSENGSQASGEGPPGRAGSTGSRGSRGAEVRPLPPLKENVKRVMFFC